MEFERYHYGCRRRHTALIRTNRPRMSQLMGSLNGSLCAHVKWQKLNNRTRPTSSDNESPWIAMLDKDPMKIMDMRALIVIFKAWNWKTLKKLVTYYLHVSDKARNLYWITRSALYLQVPHMSALIWKMSPRKIKIFRLTEWSIMRKIDEAELP